MSDQRLPLTASPITFEGAVSLEATPEGVVPWRLPFPHLALFEPPLIERASFPAGIRLTLVSDTANLTLGVDPNHTTNEAWTFDLFTDGERVERRTLKPQAETLHFPIPGAKKQRLIELYLPHQYISLRIRSVSIDAGAAAARWADIRPRWVAYGSSITHAAQADGPSDNWPAIVSRRLGLHLTNLGYGSNEHMEPLVARMIRDLPADGISICVGGNIYSLASLAERTFRSALIGFIQVIREKHPATPIVVTSFIHFLNNEGKPNQVGLDMAAYRRMTGEAVAMLQKHGDAHLHFAEGPKLFGAADFVRQPEALHPDGQAQHVLAERYLQQVMPLLGIGRGD